MAGGFNTYGPTYNSTKYVRLGYEGLLGSKTLDNTLATGTQQELAGKIAAINSSGNLVLAGTAGSFPIGLFREDLGDMVNASGMGTFYFGFGEYYVSAERLDSGYTAPAVGDPLTFNATGELKKGVVGTDTIVGTVTFFGEYDAGNMFTAAGLSANGGNFLGFLLKL